MSSSTSSPARQTPYWLSDPWYYLYVSELPITFFSILFWIVSPHEYLKGLDVSHKETTPIEYCLLIGFGAITFWAVVVINAFFLNAIRKDKAAYSSRAASSPHHFYSLGLFFSYFVFQIGMLVGDIIMVFGFAFYDYLAAPYDPNILAATIFAAGGFGILRIVWLSKKWPSLKEQQALLEKSK